MGKLILRKNGIETQFVNGEDFSTLTPEANKYVLGFNTVTGTLEGFDPTGNIMEYGTRGNFTGGTISGQTTFTDGIFADFITTNVISATTYLNLPNSGAGVIDVTYLELVGGITGNTLIPSTFYLITDFQTCYDQPDFDVNDNPITSGNYKQGPVEPILVLATNTNSISEIAYQPQYPKDRILYDWAYSTTEVTGGIAFGRISERIDEFNNRTDYDHRNILFKRYKLFTYRPYNRLNGTIEITSTNPNNVNGTNTNFTSLSVGDVIYVPSIYPNYYEITDIASDTLMSITGDSLSNFGSDFEFYKGIEETNGGGYFSYKQTNVKTADYVEYTTFGDAISNSYVKNTYIGNYVNNYQNIGSGVFLLPNNVFLEGEYESNKFGDYCYNNTFGTDNQNNTWGDYCYQNVSTNDIDNCVFGDYFTNNLINSNMGDSKVGNNFQSNQLLGENNTNFRGNTVGNRFRNNIIYSDFYENDILYGFEDNIIGDFGNLGNFQFYRNYLSNYFRNNRIRQEFQNNRVGTNFQNNTINGEFVGNTILNGFNNNQTGSNFRVNNIGNAFNNNVINDNFYYNSTDYYFNSNVISSDFIYNDIETYFQSNRPENQTLFGWNDLSTVSTRTYDNFNDVVGGGQLGNRLLGKELVMRVISTSQYFKFKFLQWTQNGNGGGFQYERQEIDSGGNTVGPNILFTKRNNINDVDIIIPGVVEITRDNNGGIYNTITEGSWNGSVSPGDTEWNSIYTELNNGERFGYNKIGNFFQNNTIGSDFGYGGGNELGNVINDTFQNNVIGRYMYNNVIGNDFQNNNIGNNFENNQIKNYFINNDIDDNFESNIIGDYFGNLQNGFGSPLANVISNNFKYNKIGDYFGNSYNYPTDGTGSSGDGGNTIGPNFENNVIGNNAVFNLLGSSFTGNRIGDYFALNLFGDTSQDNVIGNYFTGNGGIGDYPSQIGNDFTSNNIGNYAIYNKIGSFINNDIGDFFGNSGPGNVNLIAEAQSNKIDGFFGLNGGNVIGTGFIGNVISYNFYNNSIGIDFKYNLIGNTFNNNTIQYSFQTNRVGDSFTSNSIGYEFTLNQIQYSFSNNNIGFQFRENDISNFFDTNSIGDGFTQNIIKTDISGFDFSTSSHVYNGYNCEIFKNSASTPRLSYYDSSDVLNIVNITD